MLPRWFMGCWGWEPGFVSQLWHLRCTFKETEVGQWGVSVMVEGLLEVSSDLLCLPWHIYLHTRVHTHYFLLLFVVLVFLFF